MSNKIIDCFQFADEIDLAGVRFAELYDIVDQFCIVESCFDQCGSSKPYNFENNIHLFEKWKDKITYYKIEDKPPKRGEFDWSNEIYVRNSLISCINKYLKEKKLELQLGDKILFGDCDEIVNKHALKKALALNKELISFNHLFNCYKLNYYAPARNWFGAILFDVSLFSTYDSFQEFRKIKDNIEHFEDIDNPSWHFSGVGNDSFETNWIKWQTRIEPREKISGEFKDKYKVLFNKCVFEDGYFFFSDQVNRRDLDLKLEKLDFNLLPEFVKNNKDKFKNLIYE